MNVKNFSDVGRVTVAGRACSSAGILSVAYVCLDVIKLFQIATLPAIFYPILTNSARTFCVLICTTRWNRFSKFTLNIFICEFFKFHIEAYSLEQLK